jgi:hypothetical protein
MTTEEEKKAIEERFVVELGELLAKYDIRHRGNPMKNHTIKFTVAREVWNLLQKIFTEPIPEPVLEPENADPAPPVSDEHSV